MHRRNLNPTEYSERGASMLEYVLLAALIALVALGGVASIGQGAFDSFTEAGRTIQRVRTGGGFAPVPN